MAAKALSFRMRICILDAMRYIDATCGRMNRHLEGPVGPLATRAAMPVKLVTRFGQSTEAQIEDTEVLLMV